MADETNTHAENYESKKGYSGVWIGIILLVVVGLVAWFGYNSVRSQSLVDQTLREQFTWSLVPALPDPAAPGPRTTVNLQIADVVMPLGTYPGNCEIIDGKNQALLSGELSAVVCRSGEAGVELGIFKENEQLVLKKGDIASGSTRGGNFVPIVREQS
ncbi:MAG TPA: hypothetical protein VD928_03730 [Candidatus Paceibacterota bacterium]|nr:hypothetical protein [Candidatus Paceibacterota bacterium]